MQEKRTQESAGGRKRSPQRGQGGPLGSGTLEMLEMPVITGPKPEKNVPRRHHIDDAVTDIAIKHYYIETGGLF